MHVAVSTLKSLSYEHDLAATDNLRRAVQKLPETVKTRWGEKRVETLPKKTTLADLDVWLRERVRAKSMISDQALRNNGSKRVTTRPPFRRRNGRDPPPRNDLNGTEISALTTTVNASRETPRALVVCPVCSHAHKVEDCPEFKGLNIKATSSGNGGPLYPVSEAWTIPQLNLPVQRITRSEMQTWPHVADLEIPEVDSKDVTILLGANVLEAILQRELRRGSPGQPAAVVTAFGWTLTGSVKSLVAPESLHVMFIHTVPSDDDLLHRQVQNWWRTDSLGTKYEQTSLRSLDDKRALQTLQETVKHVGDRYQVGLLWKTPDIEFPDNRIMAERRLCSTEKVLKRDNALAEKYKEIIDGYVAKGHARKLTPDEIAIPTKSSGFYHIMPF